MNALVAAFAAFAASTASAAFAAFAAFAPFAAFAASRDLLQVAQRSLQPGRAAAEVQCTKRRLYNDVHDRRRADEASATSQSAPREHHDFPTRDTNNCATSKMPA